MKNDIKKAIWISYDLEFGGDYEGLYRWLANHEAVECGDGVTFFIYIPKDTGLLLEELKGEEVDPAILQPEYGRMFSKNDYLMEIK